MLGYCVEIHLEPNKEDIMAGEMDKAKGSVKQAVGDLTGNKRMKREGVIDKLSGNVKSGVDKIKKALEGKKSCC